MITASVMKELNNFLSFLDFFYLSKGVATNNGLGGSRFKRVQSINVL